MTDSAHWRVIIAVLLTAASLVLVGGSAGAANTACFVVTETHDQRMGVDEIDEASGLVLSRQMPGVMWTHNDNDPGASNDENNRIYAVNEHGELLATVQFNLTGGLDIVPGSKFVELEDISFGPGPGGDPNYLYLADTGDNNPSRPFASIYRFPEPVFTPNPSSPVTINVAESQLDATRFEYQSFINPNQIKPRNVEGVFVDPAGGNLFMFEKGLHAIDANGELADASELPREYAFVFRVKEADLFPANPATVRLATVETYVKAQFTESTGGITAADIAADGTVIAVKNRDETFYWHRNPDESVLNTLRNDPVAPCLAPYGMKGEALAIAPTTDRMVLIREGNISPIWQAMFTNQDYECFGRPATILGTAGDDFITGTSGADVIVTFGGDDVVEGKGGKDRICLGPGSDTAVGGAKRDRIDGGWDDDVLSGGSGRDILRGRVGADTISGNGGNDKIYGGSGGDDLSGGGGADLIKGASGGDDIFGKSNDDTLRGGGGSDECSGGRGTDTAAGCEDVSGVP